MTNREAYDNMWDELEQYREIGTVEQCREAVEKKNPKRILIDIHSDHTNYICPSCGLEHLYKPNEPQWGRIFKFCEWCGQAIQWEN